MKQQTFLSCIVEAEWLDFDGEDQAPGGRDELPPLPFQLLPPLRHLLILLHILPLHTHTAQVTSHSHTPSFSHTHSPSSSLSIPLPSAHTLSLSLHTLSPSPFTHSLPLPLPSHPPFSSLILTLISSTLEVKSRLRTLHSLSSFRRFALATCCSSSYSVHNETHTHTHTHTLSLSHTHTQCFVVTSGNEWSLLNVELNTQT